MERPGLRLPTPRGPISRWCAGALTGGHTSSDITPTATGIDMLSDDDGQLALWMLYELHYAGFDDVDPALEWDPALLAYRRELEHGFERALRERTGRIVEQAMEEPDVAEAVFAMCAADEAPGVATYARRRADRDQLLELLAHRSVLQLKEADPQTWVIPRLRGRAKAALVQIQYDEYGSGRPEAVHQQLYADTLAACGLDPAYGAYVDRVPGTTLALSNAVSLLGLHRRLRGAAVGYYAAVEATSSIPCRKMSQGMERLGFDSTARHFFDEHVEADAVHEQLAAREVCGSLVEDHPDLREDVLFGAATYLLVEGLFAGALLAAWEDGRSSLHVPSEQPEQLDAPADGPVAV